MSEIINSEYEPPKKCKDRCVAAVMTRYDTGELETRGFKHCPKCGHKIKAPLEVKCDCCDQTIHVRNEGQAVAYICTECSGLVL